MNNRKLTCTACAVLIEERTSVMKALNQDASLHGVIGVEHNQSCHTSSPLLEPKELSCSDSSLLKIECAKCNGNLKPPNQLSKEEGTENDICNDCAILPIGITSQSSNPQSKKHEVSVERAATKMTKLTLCGICNIKKQRNEFGKKGWKVKECKECHVKFMCQKCRSMLKQDMFCTYADGDKMKICFPCITMSTVSCMECKEELPVADFVTTKSSVDKRRCKKCFQGDETSDEDAPPKPMIEQPTNERLQICVECKGELPVTDFDETQLYTPVDKRRCKKCFQGAEPSDEDAPPKPMIEQPTNDERLQICVECKEELPVDDFDDTQLYTPIERRICKSSDPNQEVNERRQDLAPRSLKEQRVSLSSNEESRKRLRDYDGSDSEHPRKAMKQNRCIYQSQNNNSSCHLRLSALMKKIHVLGFQTCALREKVEALVESENEYKKKAVLSLRKRIDDFELCIFAVNEKLKKFDKDKNTESTRTTMKGYKEYEAIDQFLVLALSLSHYAAAKEQYPDSELIIAAVDAEDMDEVSASAHKHAKFHTRNLRSSAKETNHIKCPFQVEERNVRNRQLKSGKSKKNTTILLYQDDFHEGTYRITEPGTYKLGEDIEFGPQKNNDYWPPFELWSKYSPSAYYLGFFAAITIESDDVIIDLGGFTLRQSDEFYLLQRFFNAIELNDRVFVQNNGVSSLNYQKTDEPVSGLPAGSIVKPVNIEIKNGFIGKSSHFGIHGNGVIGLKISDVKIIEFEVSGIHCNGCKQVEVSNCEIGPSMQEVPVLGTFSNARFLEFFTKTLIPYGFEREPSGFKEALLPLFNDTISFGDRPDSEVTLKNVFERLSRALHLFRSNLFNQTIPMNETDILLLEEAKSIFENPMGLPDGSVLYGIVLNRFGFPETDENFFGAGRETEDVNLRNIKITGLHADPLEVAALMTEDHTFMQGPARDLIRIFDITSDQMRSLGASYYKGNFLSDAYFALWKLSNEFYKIRVFNSDCGNFGSNATFDMNLKLYPSYDKQTCAQLGVKTDKALSGRAVTMLQKRYFGGLQMTQDFFEWGTTSKRGLDYLLASPESADNLRRGKRHKLVCDHDTMFHPMHGVVGLKIVEAKNVKVANVDITDLHNKADLTSWVCNHKWQIQPSGEDIMPTKLSLGSPQASTVRGVEVVRSDEVSFRNIQIKHLTSDEGIVKAIDIIGDDKIYFSKPQKEIWPMTVSK